ncbi:HAD family hydrolase [Arsenicicoccus dermatophilus]|uniref:HAD family hydrolase n=1 Tax=Arsenicicoccus dermatophilus TaxID=1076331 RepID=UPI001F4D222A|nr:beta-phosphoglucomutase family hydrolase [Arsenicicoccus dermatophilus]
MDWTRYDAALFDLDGVVTPTAIVHMRAWSEMFNAFLATRGVTEPYTDADYFAHVDGKPRYDGVRSFLASRDIVLPEGDPTDGPDAETVAGLGNRKNAAFMEVLHRDGMQAYPGSLHLLDHLTTLGTKVAVVSSSQNARPVLEAAGLIDRFPVIVDGLVARQEGLPGKPAPDTFLAAAARLGVAKERAVVLEDAESGVAAGRAGDFGLVIGVDRGAGVEALTRNGADLVVSDLDELVK